VPGVKFLTFWSRKSVGQGNPGGLPMEVLCRKRETKKGRRPSQVPCDSNKTP
jgi:hypothetical protein